MRGSGIRWVLAMSLVMAGAALATGPAPPPVPPGHDAVLAEKLGADEYGMRRYVLVILKSSDTPVAAGASRDAMFKGHFANMKRLADAGTLVLAGPLDGVDGWRGLFVLAVEDVEAAKAIVATDPVVAQGEMVPEFHAYYGSAALMGVNEVHARIARTNP
ncbi:YciI family protein [Marilutibacter aestuarii]|uniref:YCII-related domain-containing protein n=1 Tax=Marilutibacter aestuarii TaxID=1706195 RepID=A0A508A3D2_9GAMM|nr:YciI family protein [Lysobacter aestuarii]TQD40362.1 hypothetical protein FKV25_14520 [Lysobacter aestuarii]